MKNFIEELEAKSEVLGIILFGSWARGDNSPESDVDLIVLKTKGFKRSVERRNGRNFEITCTTPSAIMTYWKKHVDDCFNLWEEAKIIYEKENTVTNLKNEAGKIIAKGKKKLSKTQTEHLKFDAQDEVRAAERLSGSDPITANIIINLKFLSLIELFFDIRRLSIPAPKKLNSKIMGLSPELHELIAEFYADGKMLKEKIDIANRIIPIVFDK